MHGRQFSQRTRRSSPSSGFSFTNSMRRLCADAVARLPALGHIDLAHVAISFAQTRKENVQRELIELRWGRLNLKSLALAIPADWTTAILTIRLNDKDISNKALFSKGRIEIEMNENQTLFPEDRLEVEIHRRGQL
mgnify:CR=1 FL=1